MYQQAKGCAEHCELNRTQSHLGSSERCGRRFSHRARSTVAVRASSICEAVVCEVCWLSLWHCDPHWQCDSDTLPFYSTAGHTQNYQGTIEAVAEEVLSLKDSDSAKKRTPRHREGCPIPNPAMTVSRRPSALSSALSACFQTGVSLSHRSL